MTEALLPAKSLFEQVGSMVILTVRTIISAVKPPYPYGEEFIDQFMRALQVCWFPLLVAMIAVSFGAPGLQAGLPASDRRARPAWGLLRPRRDSGVRPVRHRDRRSRSGRQRDHRRPRVAEDPRGARRPPGARRRPDQEPGGAALPGADADHGLLDIFALVAGLSSGIITELLYHESLGGFFATLLTNASVLDLAGSVMKRMLFGAIVSIVCCYKGMTVSGGAAGVGKGVNDAVVIALMGVGAFNYIFTQTLLATNPQLQTIR